MLHTYSSVFRELYSLKCSKLLFYRQSTGRPEVLIGPQSRSCHITQVVGPKSPFLGRGPSLIQSSHSGGSLCWHDALTRHLHSRGASHFSRSLAGSLSRSWRSPGAARSGDPGLRARTPQGRAPLASGDPAPPRSVPSAGAAGVAGAGRGLAWERRCQPRCAGPRPAGPAAPLNPPLFARCHTALPA